MASNQQELLAEPASEGIADASVIILAFTAERWALTCAAVESTFSQTLLPREVVLCVEEATPSWPSASASAGASARAACLRSRSWRARRSRCPRPMTASSDPMAATARASARNAHAECRLPRGRSRASSMTTPARTPTGWRGWSRSLLRSCRGRGVGGAPLPVYAKPRPRWFPFEFDSDLRLRL